MRSVIIHTDGTLHVPSASSSALTQTLALKLSDRFFGSLPFLPDLTGANHQDIQRCRNWRKWPAVECGTGQQIQVNTYRAIAEEQVLFLRNIQIRMRIAAGIHRAEDNQLIPPPPVAPAGRLQIAPYSSGALSRSRAFILEQPDTFTPPLADAHGASRAVPICRNISLQRYQEPSSCAAACACCFFGVWHRQRLRPDNRCASLVNRQHAAFQAHCRLPAQRAIASAANHSVPGSPRGWARIGVMRVRPVFSNHAADFSVGKNPSRFESSATRMGRFSASRKQLRSFRFGGDMQQLFADMQITLPVRR